MKMVDVSGKKHWEAKADAWAESKPCGVILGSGPEARGTVVLGVFLPWFIVRPSLARLRCGVMAEADGVFDFPGFTSQSSLEPAWLSQSLTVRGSRGEKLVE